MCTFDLRAPPERKEIKEDLPLNSASDVWQAVLKLLEQHLSPTAISTWFSDCQVVELLDNRLILHTGSKFSQDIIMTRYLDLVKDALKEIFAADFDVQVIGDEELARRINRQPPLRQEFLGGDQFTFDKFVVGPTNRIAYAAALAVSQNPATKYNPLFIYGDSGLGKTHLLYSIANALRISRPDFRIVYIKGDDFTNELINAIQTGSNSEFREKFRMADLLLVDDIQFIAGKIQTQEEFFHTFNALYESGRQIVLTSDRAPKDMLRLEDRLKSRFEGGLMVDVQPPDYETRVAIVKNKAARMGIPLAEEACVYIAENIKANIRQIEGILKKIQAYLELERAGILDMTLVENITREVIRSERSYTPEYIVEKTAAFYNLSPEDILGKGKTKSIAAARQMATYLMRKLTTLTLEEIGGALNRDHSTILHSIRKIEESVNTDADLSDTVRDITANIMNK
ncbi:MAG: chromosomal replication initiator protein DnaA [Oscillospiraceae bacterium]|nr:chromosomal replication initiator protein DnaA [Oscillospiraceae bacterium]